MNTNYLKDLLEKNRLSLRKCSDLLEMTAAGLSSAVEKQSLPIKKVLPLCEILDITVNEFFEIENDTKNIGVQNNAKGGNVQNNNSDCKEAIKILENQLKTKDDQIKMLIEKIK